MSRNEDQIKLFGLSNSLAERDLDNIEKKFNIDLRKLHDDSTDETYYPQFESSLRKEAAIMKNHYELFYCLEKSVRSIIAGTLKAECGDAWWDKCVPDIIQKNVKSNIQREIESGVTIRSESEIDYTTFGELSEIVKSNWTRFDSIFSNEKAFSKIMTSLNILRGPIAHCCPLAEDEVIRLQLTLKDWFRLME